MTTQQFVVLGELLPLEDAPGVGLAAGLGEAGGGVFALGQAVETPT